MAVIKKSLCFFYKCFGCPVAIALGMIAISVFSLAGALGSEIFLGLEPCEFCIYQRWPFVIAIIIGVLILLFRNNKTAVMILTGLGGLTFLANSATALYHSGIEREWWPSPLEGCSVPPGFIDGDQSWIENIMSAPAARCDEIPWADPLFGLSMANYNAILCFALFAGCMFAAFRLRKSS